MNPITLLVALILAIVVASLGEFAKGALILAGAILLAGIIIAIMTRPRRSYGYPYSSGRSFTRSSRSDDDDGFLGGFFAGGGGHSCDHDDGGSSCDGGDD